MSRQENFKAGFNLVESAVLLRLSTDDHSAASGAARSNLVLGFFRGALRGLGAVSASFASTIELDSVALARDTVSLAGAKTAIQVGEARGAAWGAATASRRNTRSGAAWGTAAVVGTVDFGLFAVEVTVGKAGSELLDRGVMVVVGVEMTGLVGL